MTTVVSEQLNYKKFDYFHPTYQYQLVQPLGDTTITVNVNGGQEIIFKLPPKAYNLSRSVLSFDMLFSATVADFSSFVFADTPGVIRSIQLLTQGGLILAEINDAARFLKIAAKPNTKYEDYINFDTGLALNQTGTQRLTTQFLSPVSCDKNFVTGIQAQIEGLGIRNDNTPINVRNREPATFYVGRSIFQLRLKVRIPLKAFNDTLFSLDKDLFFEENVIVRIITNRTRDVGFIATGGNDALLAPVNYDPTAGPPGVLGNFTMNNIRLFLAVETNTNIQQELKEKKATTGLNIIIPFVYGDQIELTGTNHNYTRRFNKGMGSKLKKLYHWVFNDTGDLYMNYNNSNIAEQSIISFNTYINSEVRQPFVVRCADFDDWLLMKDKMKGSAILNSDIYKYNWVWIEDFAETIPPIDQTAEMQNYSDGLDLKTEPRFEFKATTTGDLTHYNYAVVERVLSISNQGIHIE